MGDIEDVFSDVEADVSEEEFREAVEAKVEQMGGLADEETAAMLIAHELADEEVNGIADVEAGMDEVKFIAKVMSIGEVRTFERDGEDEDGHVVNLEVADETGAIRITFWDEQARAVDELETGQVLRIKGRPKEGYNGVEVSVLQAEPDDDVEVDVEVQDTYTVETLALGLSDVSLCGRVLDVGSVRTFDRDDGSEGRVANITLGDETGRVRVTLWDDRTEDVESLSPGDSVEVVDGYVRERDGNLELHAGGRSAIDVLDEEIEYVPDTANIADLEIDDVVDVAGVVRSVDPVRTFDRDDGSEGQVRNIRVQDKTGDVRVALWGDQADKEIAPGDEVMLADIEIQDGWQDDIEGSAGWRSTVSVLGESSPTADDADDAGGSDTGLDAFAEAGDDATDGSAEDSSADSSPDDRATASTSSSGGTVEFTGTVVQAGNPVVLDDGEETMSVETSADVHLGQEVTVRGRLHEGTIDADELF